MSEYYFTDNQCKAFPVKDIPFHGYSRFGELVLKLMENGDTHCVNYFAYPYQNQMIFLCFLANDADGSIAVLGHKSEFNRPIRLNALSAHCESLSMFEREISENYDIEFQGHPWLKPVRFPIAHEEDVASMHHYPFYTIESEELHEVGVGPVHAGIIEPGHFRFLCDGEKVLHLEIQLGYQHRGIEKLFPQAAGLKRCILAESIAGDTAVGHGLTHVMLMESFGDRVIPDSLTIERYIALELERIAMHLADSAALCTDIAYQLGQVVNESLRTIVINSTQLWCGNRFAKGLIRTNGSHYPLQKETSLKIIENLKGVMKRYLPMSDKMFSMPSVLSRFDGIGTVSNSQLKQIGAVGMAARMGGLSRDIRQSHGDTLIKAAFPGSLLLDSGDVYARAWLRRKEIEQSVEMICELVSMLKFEDNTLVPAYDVALVPDSVGIKLIEGWRGEICHAAVTDSSGNLIAYKIKDPSFHNWMALALALRNQEISDFPVCNKSFNLSYCGHDL